jgi:HK97 family phage major capsid protein
MTIEQIQAILANAVNDLAMLDKGIDAADRIATAEEKTKRKVIEDQIAEMKGELTHKVNFLETVDELNQLKVPAYPVTENPVVANKGPVHYQPATQVETPAQKSNFGCDNLGQFLQVVAKGAGVDQRYNLIVNATRSKYSNTTMSLSTDGLIIPDTWAATMLAPALTSPASLLAKATFVPLGRGDFKQPYSSGSTKDAADDWQDVAEGSTATDTSYTPEMLRIEVKKIQNKVSLTDELMDDFGPQMEEYVRRRVAAGFIGAVNRRIVNGSGISAFTGLMSSATVGAVDVTRHTQDTIIVDDIFDMEARMSQEWYNDPSTVWVSNPDCKPHLRGLKIEGSAGGVFPAFLPAGGVSGPGYDTLMGKPIFFIETPSAVGVLGDFMLVKMSDYVVAARSTSYVSKIDLSVLFNSDAGQFKFTWRAGGKLGLQAPVARENSSALTFSTCVRLATHNS